MIFTWCKQCQKWKGTNIEERGKTVVNRAAIPWSWYKPTGPCGSWLILEKYFYSAFLHRTVEKGKRCLRLAGFFSKLNPLAFGISLVKHNWCWTHLFARAKPHVHKCKLAEPDIPTSSTSVKGSLQVWNGCWMQLWGFVCAIKGRLIMCVTTERLLYIVCTIRLTWGCLPIGDHIFHAFRNLAQ